MSKKKISEIVEEGTQEITTEQKQDIINRGTGYTPKTSLKLRAFWIDTQLNNQFNELVKRLQRKNNSLISEAIRDILTKYDSKQ